MKNITYPFLEDHLKLHQSFKKNTIRLALNVLNGDEKVPTETIKFLKEWWTNHILQKDMEYRDFIFKR